MSQENVEIVRKFVDAAQAGDVETALCCFSEDVIWLNRPPEVGPYDGRDGVITAILGFAEHFDDYWFEAKQLVDARDKVVLLWRQGGKGKSSGLPITEDGATVFDVAGGRICRAQVYSGREEALKAAGL